mmetsp:Transcript_14928/g.38278  ORF Transcript_14928/g.38278 Transcript_14928/m.38278 type:complete len:212 (+) Transcript_14928:2475-3110(+)
MSATALATPSLGPEIRIKSRSCSASGRGKLIWAPVASLILPMVEPCFPMIREWCFGSTLSSAVASVATISSRLAASSTLSGPTSAGGPSSLTRLSSSWKLTDEFGNGLVSSVSVAPFRPISSRCSHPGTSNSSAVIDAARSYTLVSAFTSSVCGPRRQIVSDSTSAGGMSTTTPKSFIISSRYDPRGPITKRCCDFLILAVSSPHDTLSTS